MNDNFIFKETYTVLCLNSKSNTYEIQVFKDEASATSFIDNKKSSDSFSGIILISCGITSYCLVEVL